MKLLPRLFFFTLLTLVPSLSLEARESERRLENTFVGPEGNWEVLFLGGTAAQRAQVSVWPGKFIDGVKSEWLVECRYFGGPSDGDAHMKVDSVSEGTLTLKPSEWYFHQKDEDYATITFDVASPDVMKGTWINNEGKRGGVVARRVYPEITRVEFYPYRENIPSWMLYRSPVHHISKLPEEMPRAEYTYKESGWGDSNNMRGNRPDILVKFYGKNMWGVWRSRIEENRESFEFQLPERYIDTYIRNIRAEGDGPQPLLGRRLEVAIWGQPKPGRLTFNINGVAVPFDFVVNNYPPPSLETLRLVDREGREIDTLHEGEVFAVEARFAEANEMQKMVLAALTYPERRRVSYRLDRQEDQRIFRTPYQQLLDAESRPPEITGNIAPEVADTIADHFAGPWEVRNLAGKSYAGGRARIGEGGTSGALELNEGDRLGRYVLIDASVSSGGNGEALPRELTAVFREDVAQDAVEDGEVYPFYRSADEPGILSLELQGMKADVPVKWSEATLAANTLEFQFGRIEKTRLEGEWRSDQALGSQGKQGASWWTRGEPRIRQIIVWDEYVTDEPMLPHQPKTSGSADGFLHRRLLVLGENLPARQGSMQTKGTIPEALDGKVRYVDFALDEQGRERMLQQIFDQRKLPRPTDADQIVVTAKLEAGVTSGRKALTLGSARGYWALRFNDDDADLRFTRARHFEREDQVAVFHPGESAYLTLDLKFAEHLPDQDEMELALFAQPDDEASPRLVGRVVAKRQEETKPTFQTAALVLANDREAKFAVDGNEVTVPVKEGMRLTAVPTNQALMLEPATMVVAAPDEELGKLWIETLEKVARCPGVKGDISKPKKFAMEPGEAFTKGIYVSRLVSGDWGNHDISLRNGDHAAALLIRDEYVRQMKVLLPKYEARANNPQAVRAFWEKARRDRAAASDGFWKYNTVRGLRFPGGIPLSEVLNLEHLAENRLGGVSRIEATDWALQAVTAALKDQVEDMSTAVIRAQRAGNCDLDEIMVFAGYHAPQVVQAITSKLLVKKNGRWVPDDQAVRFVKGLYVAGRAIRALEAYSDIDNSYNAMAVAVATAGATTGLSLGGLEAAAAYTSLAGNVVDMTVVGGVGLRDYVKGERDYETAKGVAPVMGDEAVRHAEGLRKGELATALGVLFPMRSVVDEIRGLRTAGSVARGRALAKAGRNGGLELDTLTEAQKADLASYYDGLLRRRFAVDRGQRDLKPLSAEELETYGYLNRTFRSKAGERPVAGRVAGDEIDPDGVTREMPRPRPEDPFLPEGNKSLGLDPDEPISGATKSGGFDPDGVTREMPRPRVEDPFLPEGNKSLGLDGPDPMTRSDGRAPSSGSANRPAPEDPFLPEGNKSLGLDPDEPLPKGADPENDVVTATDKTKELPPPDPVTVRIPKDTPPLPIPEKGNTTVRIPEGEPPLPIRDDGNKTVILDGKNPVSDPPSAGAADAPVSAKQPVNDGGGFGMSPGGGKPPLPRKENPLPKLERDYSAARESAMQPHQGREPMDAMSAAQQRMLRQKRLNELAEEEKFYEMNHFQSRGTPEYEQEVASIRAKAEEDLAALDRAFAQEREALAKDHAVMDEVESHLGGRAYEDYSVLDVERARPGSEITKEQGVLGTLYNRFLRRRGPMQGTPAQHGAALRASGLTEGQAREFLQRWIDPTQSANPQKVQESIDRYIDWLRGSATVSGGSG